ncbi:hypothetical protein MKW98_010799 [Papaver atlanticum]|uniref:Uncharacterized protein n=1 Tax=Papaver atlanticum TaxID=357466 RepID=A0AAD4XG48_9MAGN|nr:hypothetical protein MKW98_010799 [Papaver atlanticum]
MVLCRSVHNSTVVVLKTSTYLRIYNDLYARTILRELFRVFISFNLLQLFFLENRSGKLVCFEALSKLNSLIVKRTCVK